MTDNTDAPDPLSDEWIAEQMGWHQPSGPYTDDCLGARVKATIRAALASRDAEIARVHAAYCHSQQQFLDAQAEITKIRQGEAVALPNCTVADVGFRWDGDKQEHIPQVLVSFTPVPANRPNDDKGWKDRDAFAGMLASPPPAQPPQAEPLSETDIVRCAVESGCVGTVKMTFDSGPYEITRTSINADRFARAIERLITERMSAGGKT